MALFLEVITRIIVHKCITKIFVARVAIMNWLIIYLFIHNLI